jgi:hypothetical protein
MAIGSLARLTKASLCGYAKILDLLFHISLKLFYCTRRCQPALSQVNIIVCILVKEVI